eukprot:239752-Chlamydomonas_euryale.AAC.2
MPKLRTSCQLPTSVRNCTSGKSTREGGVMTAFRENAAPQDHAHRVRSSRRRGLRPARPSHGSRSGADHVSNAPAWPPPADGAGGGAHPLPQCAACSAPGGITRCRGCCRSYAPPSRLQSGGSHCRLAGSWSAGKC